MTKSKRTVYPEKVVKESIEAIKNGMSIADVRKAMGFKSDMTSIYDWIKKAKVSGDLPLTVLPGVGIGIIETKSAKSSPCIDEMPYHRHHPILTLDEFVGLLRQLISEYTRVKEELVILRKSNAERMRIAGKALEEAQQALLRDK